MAAPECRRPGARLRERLAAPKALGALACANPRRRTLRCAETLACLRRDLARSARDAGRVRRSCSWISQPPRVPKLLAGPLEGRCLASLVVETKRDTTAPRPAEPQASRPDYPKTLAPAGARPASHGSSGAKVVRCAPPEPWVGRRRERGVVECPPARSAEPITKEGVPARSPEPCALAPRAPLRLLERHCVAPNAIVSTRKRTTAQGGAFSPPWHPERAPHAPVSQRNTRVSLENGGGQRGIPNADPPFTRGSRREVAQRLAARLAQSMLRHSSAWPASTGRTRDADVLAAPSSAAASSWARASFEATPSGPSAPLALLVRILRSSELAREAPRTAPRGGENPSGGASPFLTEWVERSGQQLEGARRPIETTPTPEAPSPPGEAAEGARQGYYPQSGTLDLPAAGAGGGRPLLAPPLAADTSPTLAPARFAFDAPTPIASATLRREAKRDESASDDELDVLADKLKRILEEQARRHGIGA
jgi:hypothetical protein